MTCSRLRSVCRAISERRKTIHLTGRTDGIEFVAPAHRETSWVRQPAALVGRDASQTPGIVQGLAGVRAIAADDDTSVAVLSSGRIMTWGEVRPWARPDGGDALSPLPILPWVDGLDQT